MERNRRGERRERENEIMVERERDDSAKRSNAKSRMIRRREKGGGKWEGVGG